MFIIVYIQYILSTYALATIEPSKGDNPMFNTLIDQLVIGSECKIIESTDEYVKYRVGDMIITLYRQIGGRITCAVIRPVRKV